MSKFLVTNPYCPFCGVVRRADAKNSMCIPCGNAGHAYRLVLNEQDRLTRVTNWLRFYSEHGYTNTQIKSIPWFNNFLIGRTFNAYRGA